MAEKMRVKYIGDYYKVTLIKNKIYTVLDIENGMYKIKTELADEDFDDGDATAYFPPTEFEIVD